MTGRMRVGTALVAGLLGFSAAASAQIPGMPLFTNPRYGTGVRIHADLGQATGAGELGNDNTVVQGGVTFALGPVGIGANIGTNLRRAQALGSGDTIGINDNFTASALAQLRVFGGGQRPAAISIFGGATADITAQEAAAMSVHYKYPRLMNFPVGLALGYHVPLGMLSFNVWGSGRMVFSKYMNCPATDPVGAPGISQMCSETKNDFRWAVGFDLPFLKVLSLRAAYDGGKWFGVKMDSWGVGASIGLGGMR
jgi:hypothetical protein